jgi:peptidoglycan/xylan/chitin deacetylase (PgdA/CDA1 family)
MKPMIRLPIFMYHHVSESLGLSEKGLEVFPNEFEQQMRFLFQKGFRCLSLSEVITNWQQGKTQPKRSFVLTFDDGYFDFYENALPILKDFGFTATIFVVVDRIENGNKEYLSWQNIKELTDENFIIGSHTLTHPRLCSLQIETITHELFRSKEIIEDKLGKPVSLLAYPYGESNESVQDIASKSGYQAAFGINIRDLSQFNLWRVPVKKHESKRSFSWKAHGGYYFYTCLLTQTHMGRKMRVVKRYMRGEPPLPILEKER